MRRNRAGIRQLADDQDLWGHFLPDAEAGVGTPREADPAAEGGAATERLAAPPRETDRHGIPRLDRHADLRRLFRDAAEDAVEADELEKAFRQSLAQDPRRLMKKKGEGLWEPRRLSLKEQLRRYPPPQGQLDLHGATALEARHRAEAFLRSAAADGLFTVRLIVGKGLHSEGGAVLPDVIEDLLRALKRERRVLTYRWENRLKRKSGALIVYLPATFRS